MEMENESEISRLELCVAVSCVFFHEKKKNSYCEEVKAWLGICDAISECFECFKCHTEKSNDRVILWLDNIYINHVLMLFCSPTYSRPDWDISLMDARYS